MCRSGSGLRDAKAVVSKLAFDTETATKLLPNIVKMSETRKQFCLGGTCKRSRPTTSMLILNAACAIYEEGIWLADELH